MPNPLFRPYGTMEVSTTPYGTYKVRRLPDQEAGIPEGTYEMSSLEGYEPLNAEARALKQRWLICQGFQPMPETPHRVTGELIACGPDAYVAILDGLRSITKRYGMSVTVVRQRPTYVRRMPEGRDEYRSGVSTTTQVYLNKGPDSSTLPVTREDIPTILEALDALRQRGWCDTQKVDELREKLGTVYTFPS